MKLCQKFALCVVVLWGASANGGELDSIDKKALPITHAVLSKHLPALEKNIANLSNHIDKQVAFLAEARGIIFPRQDFFAPHKSFLSDCFKKDTPLDCTDVEKWKQLPPPSLLHNFNNNISSLNEGKTLVNSLITQLIDTASGIETAREKSEPFMRVDLIEDLPSLFAKIDEDVPHIFPEEESIAKKSCEIQKFDTWLKTHGMSLNTFEEKNAVFFKMCRHVIDSEIVPQFDRCLEKLRLKVGGQNSSRSNSSTINSVLSK